MKSSNTTSQKLFGGLLVALLGLLSINASNAQILLFNNFNPDNSLTQASGNGSAWEYSATNPYGFTTAEEFTVAPGTNYTLDSVTLGLEIDQYRQDADPSNFAVQFLSTNNDGTPGAIIATLATGTSSLTNQLSAVTFNSVGDIVLDGGSSYWVKVTPLTINTASTANNEAVVWWYTTQPVASTSSIQYINNSGIYDTYQGSGSGGYMQVLGTSQSVPEPSTWAMLLGGLGLLAFWHKRTRQARI
jgi:hypothetical protein